MNGKKLSFSIIIGVFVIAITHACVDHHVASPQVECSGVDEISYVTQVKPIIDAKCAIVGNGGCHNGGLGPDLDWREFVNVQSHAVEMQDRITRPAGSAGHMPKLGSLTATEIQRIYCWAAQGAANN